MRREVLAVAQKDLRIEWRSRVVISQIAPFGVIALILCALAIGPSTSALRHGAPGLYYLVILLVALLTIGRSQAIESRPGTHTSVRLLGIDPGATFLGKALALFVELLAVGAVLLVGIVLLFHVDLARTALAAPSAALALAAIAAAGTIYGAVVGESSSQATLLPIVILPPFAAVLISGEKSMAATLDGGSSWRWIGFLALCLVAYVAAGLLLYGVTEESR